MWLARLRRHSRRPDRCLACGGDFVYPVHWHEADATHYWLHLRCGECGTWREGVFSDDAIDRFERRLDEASEQIVGAADRLHREWRSTEVEAFAAALDKGLIDPGDFIR